MTTAGAPRAAASVTEMTTGDAVLAVPSEGDVVCPGA